MSAGLSGLDPQMIAAMMSQMGGGDSGGGGAAPAIASAAGTPTPMIQGANADGQMPDPDSNPPVQVPQMPLPTPPQAPNMRQYGPAKLGNPAQQQGHGGFRQVIKDMLYQGAQAMKRAYGIPTDDEVAKQDYDTQMQDYNAKVAAVNAQNKSTLLAAQAKAALQRQDTAAKKEQAGDELVPTQIPDPTSPTGFATIMVRRQDAPKMGAVTGRTVVGKQANEVHAAASGYTINPDNTITPKDINSLSETQRAAINANNAKVALDKAEADVKMNPDNPTNQIKLKQLQGMMAYHYGMLRNAERNTNLRSGMDAFKMGQATQYGDPNDPSSMMAQVSPAAQKVLMSTNPIKSQISDLIQRIDTLKLGDNNTLGFLALPRAKYGMGIASPEGELGSDISKLDMSGILGSARILAGSSRSYQALKKGMVHTPDTVFDSPKNMRQKLVNMLQNVDDVEQDAIKFGRKSGIVPVPHTGVNPVRSKPGQQPVATKRYNPATGQLETINAPQ